MAQYIDKDALVAEINRRRNQEVQWMEKQGYTEYHQGLRDGYANTLFLFNTLEVKEVNLEKEINRWQGCEAFPEGTSITPLPKAMEIVERTAKHFFELGLKVSKE